MSVNIKTISRKQRNYQRSVSGPIRNRYSGKFVCGNIVYNRLCMVLSGTGCSTPTCTMCPLPSFGQKLYSIESYRKAISAELESINRKNCDRINMLSIYNDGSYYSDNELSDSYRNSLEDLVKEYRVELFNVETTPLFFDEQKILRTLERSGAKLLVNVGIQSFNSDIRRYCVGSPFSEKSIFHMFEIANKLSVDLRVYLLFKAPFLNEWEAIEDLNESLSFCRTFKVKLVSINPCKVSKGTVLADIYSKGLYRVPHYYSLFKLLDRFSKDIDIRAELPSSGSCPGDIALPHICYECEPYIKNYSDKDITPICWIQHLHLEDRKSWNYRFNQYMENGYS